MGDKKFSSVNVLNFVNFWENNEKKKKHSWLTMHFFLNNVPKYKIQCLNKL